jgi:hypothetical protein
MRELPFNVDVTQEQEKIEVEDMRQSLLSALEAMTQAIPQMATQGQDPSGIIFKISTAIQARKGGRAIEDTMAEVFAPEPQSEAPAEQTPGDMMQEGEQPGMPPQGGMIPPVGGAQAPEVKPPPPDIQSIMARLTSGGKATGSATTTSQNRRPHPQTA